MTYLTLIHVNMADEYGGFFNKNRMLYLLNWKVTMTPLRSRMVLPIATAPGFLE